MFWNRPRLVSKKYKDAQSRRRRILLLSFGFVVVVLIGILLWLGYSKTFTIEKIEIKGITTIKEGELRSILDDILEDKLFFIFPRNNTALVPKKSLAENLKKTFTQIKDISVNIKDQHGIALTIKERKPIGVWCNGNAEETIETEKTTVKCFLLDDLGYVFSEAPLFSGNLFFKYFGGNLQRTAVSGVYLPKDIFSERIFFITSLKTLGLNPVAYTWGDDGDSILELSPKGDVGVKGKVIFNNTDDMSDVFEHLSLALTHDDFKDRDLIIIDVEYIDLRSSDKIFYKLRGE